MGGFTDNKTVSSQDKNRNMDTLDYTIKVARCEQSTIKQVDWDNISFGKEFSDHMLIMDYKDGAWQMPEIMPFGPIPMHPSMSAIHYGQSIFEGMKAYRTINGDSVIFRPDKNAQRFRLSAKRMCMPEIPEDLFLFCLHELLKVDQDWISDKPENSLYIRPFMFSTDGYTGVKISNTYRFMIFTCPSGAYYKEPLAVKIEEKYSRAVQGGVGNVKAAGNYGLSLYPTQLAAEEGYQQIIWTDGRTHKYIDEAGTMNVLFVIDGKLVTPEESTDTILHGVTKRSVIELAKDWGITVEERKISVEEVVAALKNGTMTEAFGAGTAATIAPIKSIGFRDVHYDLPDNGNGPFIAKMSKGLEDIKFGRVEDKFDWVVNV